MTEDLGGQDIMEAREAPALMEAPALASPEAQHHQDPATEAQD